MVSTKDLRLRELASALMYLQKYLNLYDEQSKYRVMYNEVVVQAWLNLFGVKSATMYGVCHAHVKLSSIGRIIASREITT